jgi:dihydrofolate reductase
MSRAPRRGRSGTGIVTSDLSISLDGCSAGRNQSLDHPFGDGVEAGESLHSWMFDHADEHRAELAAITAAGVFIMGRNMFGPGRGAWDLDQGVVGAGTAVPRAGVRAHSRRARPARDGRRRDRGREASGL